MLKQTGDKSSPTFTFGLPTSLSKATVTVSSMDKPQTCLNTIPGKEKVGAVAKDMDSKEASGGFRFGIAALPAMATADAPSIVTSTEKRTDKPFTFKGFQSNLESQWRKVNWKEEQKTTLMKRVSSYRPSCEEVTDARVLLLGPVGSGKSSFISSVQSVFNGRVTNRAMVGSSSTSFTKKLSFCSCQLQSFNIHGQKGEDPSRLVLCDIMGLGGEGMTGLTLHDILSIIKGHVPEGHKFSPDQPVRSETVGYVKRPSLADKIHCVAFVVDASKILTYPEGLSTTFQQLRECISDLGVHQVALLTHVDKICPETAKDVTQVYKSGRIQDIMGKAGALLGMSTSYIVPVKNYSSELDLDANTDVLLLSAVDHILQYADLYFQDNGPQYTVSKMDSSDFQFHFRRNRDHEQFGTHPTVLQIQILTHHESRSLSVHLEEKEGDTKVSKHHRSNEHLLHTTVDQLSIMNPRLTRSQQRTICSQLRRVKLQLLYKASIHGFTGAAFHQRCDNRSPTVSVGYNTLGYVFGGYTKQPFSQSGQYMNDDQAFLFTFSGEKLLKYPVTSAVYAVKMIANSGPYFGEALVLVNGSQAVVYSNPGTYYNFSAVEMHGNNLNLTECEVYQVEETTELERPWRTVIWESEKRNELINSIKVYKPTVRSLSQVRVLLIGPVGAGKSSFFNSINSVFRGHVTSQAIAGSCTTSLTTQFRTYSLKAGRGGEPLPIILCDTMGLEESIGAGLDIEDICSILKGHLPDRYQFNPSAPLHSEAHSYRTSPGLRDKINCVAYVIDACKISIMSAKLEEKLEAIRRKVNSMGIPQLVLLTKVDEACPLVTADVRNVYKSGYIKEMIQEVSARLGVPLSCVVPVKNYSEELELDINCDILLLSALVQMLRFADNYFDDISDRLGNIEKRE
ncbi:interferon-induced protein 44f5 [Xiphias gladius]|uniref:interferon-induced protein 44f5 n=1 Tax=Xiphias gladius TaxID=8245 RepID=UPI001A999A14|nr:interferon-induced protein 44f5 [Xiphias gladius]